MDDVEKQNVSEIKMAPFEEGVRESLKAQKLMRQSHTKLKLPASLIHQ